MTTFSRPRVAFNLAAIPFNFLRVMASSAFASAIATARNAIDDIRAEFMPGVRYVLTGNFHPTAIVDRAAEVVDGMASKVASARSAAYSFFERHLLYRLVALFFIVVSPIVAVLLALEILKNEDFFSGFADAYRDLFRSVLTGEEMFV